jgi:hypothetical protein
MIARVKKEIMSRITNILKPMVRDEIENLLPIMPQLIEFKNSAKEDKQSFYDHSKYTLGSIGFYEGLKDRLIRAGIPVVPVEVDLQDFERWLTDFPDIRKHYANMGNVFIEKCLEHYLTFTHLNITSGNVYVDIASSGSPWARTLCKRRGVRAYRLDLSFPKGIKGIDIGADASHTKLPDGFASILSLQCAYECFMGDADILFLGEASRILDRKGRYGIVPLYLSDVHFVSTSPYCNQAEVIVEPEARKVWRDDEYKEPFSRHYSPESFAVRIYSSIPADMEGKILYFKNLPDIMQHYKGQKTYCFFMFLCEKKEGSA